MTHRTLLAALTLSLAAAPALANPPVAARNAQHPPVAAVKAPSESSALKRRVTMAWILSLSAR